MKNIKKTILLWLKNKKSASLALLVILAVPIFSGCGTQSNGYAVKLEIWGVLDESAVYNDVITKYKELNPYAVEIKYRKFSPDTYKQELIDGLASGQGPDIFLINNAWLPSFENKIEPAPSVLMGEQELAANFPDVVSFDFMDKQKVYAVPLSVDSLQLYYNKDIFNAAGMTTPPKNWQEFGDAVQKLTRVDATGNIIKAGVAMGTTQNVSRFADIFTTLMIQNGVQLPMEKGVASKIDQGVVGQDGNIIQAGEQALGYYTQFAKTSTGSNLPNPLYSWNSRQINSVDAFASGNVAMILGYSWQGAGIKSKNPKLNFAVAPVPQTDASKPATVAGYWGYAVAKNKISPTTNQQGVAVAPIANEVRTHEAWQFLKFLTLKNTGKITLVNAITKGSKDFPVSYDPALEYLKKTKQPAARRDLIELQKTDAQLGVFAAGNLIARSWYRVDPENTEKIFAEGIDAIISGSSSLRQVMLLINNRLNVLMQVKR
jgi:multiple sugar transport system substrate-binding protein